MTCEEYRDLLNQHLDGVPAAEALREHPRQCPDCAALYRGANRFKQALGQLKPPAPPRYLTNYILLDLRDDKRERLALRLRGVATLLAAAVLLVVGIPTVFWPKPRNEQQAVVPPSVPQGEPARAEKPPTLRDTVNQAGQAFGQLTTRTADETVGQTKSFWATLTPPINEWERPGRLEPDTRPLQETGHSAVVALEPMTNSARRAFDRLLHDLPPMDQPAKPDS
jgi:hypothetical protein